MLPEITVKELSEKLKSEDKFILLDVRELHELNYAKLTDARVEVVPMSQLGQVGTEALSEAAKSRSAEMYVMCHHGSRSAQVTAWLVQQGWTNIKNVHGGIDEYARQVDHAVGFY